MKNSETAKRILSMAFIVSIMLSILVMPINGSIYGSTMVEIPELKLTEATMISSFDEEYFGTVVKDLKARGIFVGYPDGTMGEYKSVTRAEMATVCTRRR